jgi:hypothetical protein
MREEIEYKISESSDVISYNASPILKVSGALIGEEPKGETRKVYQVENGGDISYVSWNQSQDAVNSHINRGIDLIFMQTQMPDISYAKMVGMGNIGYDARQTVFMDTYLKVNDEQGEWIEFFDREVNVVKAYLKKVKLDWADEVDNVVVTVKMTPYNMKSISESIKTMMEANGGKPLLSQEESVQMSCISTDPEETLRKINEEADKEIEQQGKKINNLFQ